MKKIIIFLVLVLNIVTIASAYIVAPIEGPYSRWDFENNLLDTGTQGWDITNGNIVGYTTGKFGSAIITNETSVLFLDINYPYTDDFYLGCWVKRYSAVTNNDFYFCFGTQNAYPYSCLATAVAYGNSLIYSNAGNQDFNTGYQMPINEWVHIAMYRNATEGQMHVLVNGSQVYQGSYGVGGNEDITFAYNYNGIEALDGEIDNCFFLPKIPTQSELAEILAVPQPPPSSCDAHQLYFAVRDTYGTLNGTNYHKSVPESIWVIFDRTINDTCDIEFSPDNSTWTTFSGEHYGDIPEWCGITSMEFPPGTHYLRAHGYPNDGGAELESCSYYFEPELVPEEPVQETRRGNNAASIIVQQNLAKQAEATSSKPKNIIEAIAQVIMNIRKALGLEG